MNGLSRDSQMNKRRRYKAKRRRYYIKYADDLINAVDSRNIKYIDEMEKNLSATSTGWDKHTTDLSHLKSDMRNLLLPNVQD